MGFYYGSSEPPQEEKQGTLKEALLITLIVFKALALPVAILLGGIAYLVLLFYLFTWHPLAGLGGLALIAVVFGARALWEWRNPPSIDDVERHHRN